MNLSVSCTDERKVESLRNEVDTLEMEKWKSTTHILKLNKMIDELQTDTNSYSIQLSYSDYLP